MLLRTFLPSVFLLTFGIKILNGKAATLDWGIIDLDMLVDSKDRDSNNFFEFRIVELPQQPWTKKPAIFFAEQGGSYPRFNIEIGRTKMKLPDKMAPPFPRYQDSFNAKINFASNNKFWLEIQAWQLANSVDFSNCTGSSISVSENYRTITFLHEIQTLNPCTKTIGIYPEFDSQIALNLSKLVHACEGNFLLGDRSIRSLCDSRIPILPADFAPFSRRQFTVKNYYLESNGSKKKVNGKLVIVFDNSSTLVMSQMKEESEMLKACSKFSSVKCFPYFIYGPEFSSELQGKIRCRPVNRNDRHLEEICYEKDPTYIAPSLGVKCTWFSVDGMLMPQVRNGRLLLYLIQRGKEIKVDFICRIPNDQRHAIIICPDNSKAFCDPSFVVLKDNEIIFDGFNISSTSTSNLAVNNFTGFKIIWGDNKGDFRFLAANFTLPADLKTESYRFLLRFRNKILEKRYGETIVADIDLLVVEKGAIYYTDDLISRFVQHDVDIGQNNLELNCGSSFFWLKWIDNKFQSKDELVENYDPVNLDESIRAFIYGTTVTEDKMLAFEPISVAHGGFYRCGDDDLSIWHYHLFNVRKPSRCYAWYDRESAKEEIVSPKLEPFLAYGVTFKHVQRSTSAGGIQCEIKCPHPIVCYESLLCTRRTLKIDNFTKSEEEDAGTQVATCDWQPETTERKCYYGTRPITPTPFTFIYSIADSLNHVKRAVMTPGFIKEHFPVYFFKSWQPVFYEAGRFDHCTVIVSDHTRFSHVEFVRVVLPEFAPVTVTYLCTLRKRREPVRIAGGLINGTNWNLTHNGKLISASDISKGYLNVLLKSTFDPWKVAIKLDFLTKVGLNRGSLAPKKVAGNYSLTFEHQDPWDDEELFYSDAIPKLWLQIEQLPPDSLERNCRRSRQGFEYAGTLDTPICGPKCLDFSDDGRKYDVSKFPEAYNPSKAKNYCRNRNERDNYYGLNCKNKSLADVYCFVPHCTEVKHERRLLEGYVRRFGLCLCLNACTFLSRNTLYQCADACSWQGDTCVSFHWFHEETGNRRCALRRRTPCEMPCASPELSFHAMYDKKPGKNMPPLEPDYSENPPGVESYWVHHFEEGARYIFLECKLFSIIGTNENGTQTGATWEIYNPKSNEFETLPEERYRPYTEASTGFYLNFGNEGRLQVKHSGLYRCKASDGKFEYHRLEVFAPMRCLIFINRQYLELTESIYLFVFEAKKSYGQLVFNLICNVGERLVEFDWAGKLVNPGISFVPSNNIASATTRHDPFRHIIAIEAPLNGDVVKRFSISFRFKPNPVPNTNQQSEIINIDRFLGENTEKTQFSLQFPNIFSARITVNPWPLIGTHFSIENPTSNNEIKTEIRLDPATKLRASVEYKLLEPLPKYHLSGFRTFCSGENDDWREGCFRVVISIQSCGCNMSEFLPKFSRKISTCWHLVEISASLKSPVSFTVSLDFTGNSPTFDVEKYLKMMRIASDKLVIGVTVIDSLFNFHSQINSTFHVKIAPTVFASQKPYDCFINGNGTDYTGVLAESGCLKRPCLDWDDPRFASDWRLKNIKTKEAKKFCRTVEVSKYPGPVCIIGVAGDGTPIFDACNVPFCRDFLSESRFSGYKQSHSCDNNYPPINVPDVTYCQSECSKSKTCAYSAFLNKNCFLYHESCNTFNTSDCSSLGKFGNSFFYYQKQASIVGEIFQVFHIESGTRDVRMPFPPGLIFDGDANFTFFTRFGSSEVPNDVKWGIEKRVPLLKFHSKIEKSKHEGIYVVNSPSIPTHYAIVKVNRPPVCRILANGTNEETFELYVFDVKKVVNRLLGQDETALVNVNLFQLDCTINRVGLCADGVTICNPRIGIFFPDTKTFAYKMWLGSQASVTEKCPGVYFAFYENNAEESRIKIRLTVNQKLPSLAGLVLYFRFYPTTQEWPIESLGLLEDDDANSTLPADAQRVLSNAFKSELCCSPIILNIFSAFLGGSML